MFNGLVVGFILWAGYFVIYLLLCKFTKRYSLDPIRLLTALVGLIFLGFVYGTLFDIYTWWNQ